MAVLNIGQVKISNAAVMDPRVFVEQVQRSGALTMVGGKDFTRVMGLGTQEVYGITLGMSAKPQVERNLSEEVPGLSVNGGFVSVKSFFIQTRAPLTLADTVNAQATGLPITSILDEALLTATYQAAADLLVVGDGSNTGLLNSAGVTKTALPADSNGKTDITDYDNGQLASFIADQILAAATATNTLDSAPRIACLTTQRLKARLAKLVQLTSAQREGAGSLSVWGTVLAILKGQGITDVSLKCHDRMAGYAGGKDPFVVSIAEYPKTMAEGGEFNTNAFGERVVKNNPHLTVAYDAGAPMIWRANAGATTLDQQSVYKCTPAMVVRPEGMRMILVDCGGLAGGEKVPLMPIAA